MTTRVAISGAAGRMGKALAQAVTAAEELRLTCALEHPSSPWLGQDVGEVAGSGQAGVIITDNLPALCEEFDVLIDFTIADATAANIEVCAAHDKAMVIGTTGLNAAQQQMLEQAAKQIAVVKAHNFSVGVNVTFKLAEMAAAILGTQVDIEIIEAHHKHKVDAPSGTAVGLGEVIAKSLEMKLSEVAVYGREGITGARKPGTIGFHSIRAGDIIGEHTVVFAGEGERIELTHKAQSLTNFAQGAIRSAVWVADKPAGLFDMRDVLGL